MSRTHTRSLRLMLVSSLFALRAASAQAAAADISSPLQSGTLSFVGHATVGDFVGTTSQVTGAFSGTVASAYGWVEAPVASLVTNNDRRDRDLRASMEVDRYPTIRFDLDSTVVASSRDDAREAVDVMLHGRFAIHGVTRVVELPAAVSRRGDTLQVNAVFPLDVTEYRIGGLKKLFGMLRMRRQIEVHVDLRFVRATNDIQSLTSSRQENSR